jgi:hypothetical protein
LALYHLVAVEDRRVDIIDLKTDTPHPGSGANLFQIRHPGPDLMESCLKRFARWKHHGNTLRSVLIDVFLQGE